MWKTTSSSHPDLAAGIDDGDGFLDPSCPFEGLCCPNDPLDEVLNFKSSVLGHGFFESLAVEFCPPREPSGGGRGGGGEEDCKGALERAAFGARAAESSLGGSGSGGCAVSEVSVPGGGRGEDDARLMSAVVEVMDTEALDVKPCAGAGVGGLSAPGAGAGAAGYMSAPLAVAMGTPGAFPENKPLPLRLPTLLGVRSATPSAPPGTPFRWEHAAPSSGVSTTPSDSSLSTASLVSESPAVASPPDVLSLAVPRRRRSPPVQIHKSHWSLICPLHLVPVAARYRLGGKSINALHAGAFSSDGGSGGGEGSGGSYHRRVVGRQRNRQVRKDRRCSHCGTSETPQWRMGPEGPGTLCNACGIRSKMDRLLPEYRPSTSPSFNGDEHSNRHRKVLKLREKKSRN
ncbi:hypothetical protein E2562_001898 [Oryza meyeriana var. granulata]|uniref:GATA-type domain-containing protein n=1 Tax=Oryza meyeriana var. granulata TaxID=110450 RepID=A0A6G1C2C2_9ORYZ|nr:hypothetical protein E2562_001898 [Oryza meyeriana var. granulata]